MKSHLRIFDNTQLRLGLLFSSNFCRHGTQGVPDEMAVQRRNHFSVTIISGKKLVTLNFKMLFLCFFIFTL